MTAISFSCEAKKQALMEYKCQQTIRPKRKREIRVGDKLTLYWHQREKPCCLNCLTFEECCFVIPSTHKDTHGKKFPDLMPNCKEFNNILGYGEVTEVFDISMDIRGHFRLSDDELMLINFWNLDELKDLAKQDGFETVWDFIKWFDTHYSLDTPKEFTVIRWKWLT